MSRERFEEQREQFKRALARLHDALRQPENEFMRDAIIQRFEFTFEMAWRCLYRYLVSQGERVAQQAFSVLPLAFRSLLIEDAAVWDELRENRNLTSHTYDEKRAIAVAAFVRARAAAAFDTLSAKLDSL